MVAAGSAVRMSDYPGRSSMNKRLLLNKALRKALLISACAPAVLGAALALLSICNERGAVIGSCRQWQLNASTGRSLTICITNQSSAPISLSSAYLVWPMSGGQPRIQTGAGCSLKANETKTLQISTSFEPEAIWFSWESASEMSRLVKKTMPALQKFIPEGRLIINILPNYIDNDFPLKNGWRHLE